MSIEKLKLLNIGGALEHLNNALICCLESGVFHIENAAQVMAGASEGFSSPSESDPYAEPLKKLLGLHLQSLPLDAKQAPPQAAFTPDQLHTQLDRITEVLSSLQQQLSDSRALLAEYQRKGVRVRMYTDYGVFTPCSDSRTFASHAGQAVSIFNISAKGLRSTGLEYPIYDFTSLWQGTLNRSTGEAFTIEAEGEYIVFQTY